MKHHHIAIILLLGAILITLALILGNAYLEAISVKSQSKIGVSFSPTYVKELGLNPKVVYRSIMTDLGVKHLRLNASWDEIEPVEGQFDFSDLDFYINEAATRGVQVILTVGYKLPRWPECRAPKWLEGATTQLRQEKQLKFVKEVIQKYNNNSEVTAFQIENEPLLEFGICPKPDREFLQQEMVMVKKVTSKPIILTDSGELRSWVTPMRLSDIFGTTLYRVVDVPFLGQTRYPLQPWFYRVKSSLVRKFFAQNNQKTIIVELQAETWATQPLPTIPVEVQTQRFSLEEFKKTLEYSKRTGFEEIYLWGVEWWYYLAQNGHPEYLEYAKGIF